jgi:hypothetical protein
MALIMVTFVGGLDLGAKRELSMDSRTFGRLEAALAPWSFVVPEITGFHPNENDPFSGKNPTSTKARFRGVVGFQLYRRYGSAYLILCRCVQWRLCTHGGDYCGSAVWLDDSQSRPQ